MYPKPGRVFIIETADERFSHFGQQIKAVTAAKWSVKRKQFSQNGYQVVQRFRVPMRRLAPRWGWWGFAVIAMDRQREES